MPSITEPDVLTGLIARLEALRPDTPRRWGTMTAGEMLCHLGDAASSVLNRGGTRPARSRPILRWVALYSPLRWPRDLKTPPSVDPKARGTKPSDFEADRRRAIEGLRALATAPDSAFATTHSAFGTMRSRDWHRWAYRHTDHHLRQFGV